MLQAPCRRCREPALSTHMTFSILHYWLDPAASAWRPILAADRQAAWRGTCADQSPSMVIASSFVQAHVSTVRLHFHCVMVTTRGGDAHASAAARAHRASGLNLLVNAITLWNTRYLNRAIAALRETKDVPDHLLAHLSPLGWEHMATGWPGSVASTILPASRSAAACRRPCRRSLKPRAGSSRRRKGHRRAFDGSPTAWVLLIRVGRAECGGGQYATRIALLARDARLDVKPRQQRALRPPQE
jgi:hypothetical protein